MTYTPKHLKPYTRPENYAGPTYYGYFPFMGQSRDSDALERSNFRCALAAVGGESDTVLVIRDSHWAVGWVETIYIHESDENALRAADKVRGRLEDYPVVNESDYSELEWEEAAEYWAQCSVRERARIIRDMNCGVSIFAARRAYIPQDDNGRLYEYLTTN